MIRSNGTALGGSERGNVTAGDDEIDLLDLWEVIWGRRMLILGVTFMFGVLAAAISLRMPEIYRAEVLIVPASDGGSVQGSSALAQLGGLASLAGISIGSSSSSEENLAVLQSRTFLWAFIQENDLMPVLYPDEWDATRKSWKTSDLKEQPSLWDAYRMLTKEAKLDVEVDKKSDLITVAVELRNAEVAAKVANDLVARLNDYLRYQAIQNSQGNLVYLYDALGKTQVQEVRQSLFDLISQEQKKSMLASTQKDFAFKVIDAASAPDKKAKPKRALIVILAAVFGGFIAIFWVFLQKGIQSRRKQEGAISAV